MAFSTEYTEKALKYLESLEMKEAARIYDRIESIKENPLHYIQKLTSVDLWKLRVGDYRAILQLKKAQRKIVVIDIGHRKNVYKNL